MSGRHTRVYMDEIYPRAGCTFYSNERRPILEFTEDTSPGKHDCIVAACDPYRYEHLGAEPAHVRETIESAGSLRGAIHKLQRNERTLKLLADLPTVSPTVLIRRSLR